MNANDSFKGKLPDNFREKVLSEFIRYERDRLIVNLKKMYKTVHVDDHVQEAFKKLLEACETDSEGFLKGIGSYDNLKGWLFMVARNACLDEYRKQKKDRALFEDYGRLYAGTDEIKGDPDQKEPPDPRSLIQSLPEKLAAPLTLMSEGKKPKEISKILDVPESTVRDRLNKGKALLSEKTGDREDD